MSDSQSAALANMSYLVSRTSSIGSSSALPTSAGKSSSTLSSEISDRLPKKSNSVFFPSVTDSTSTASKYDFSSTLSSDNSDSSQKLLNSVSSVIINDSIPTRGMSSFPSMPAFSASDSNPTLALGTSDSSQSLSTSTSISISTPPLNPSDTKSTSLSDFSNFSSTPRPSTSEPNSTISQTALESISRTSINNLSSNLSLSTNEISPISSLSVSQTNSAPLPDKNAIDWSSASPVDRSDSVSVPLTSQIEFSSILSLGASDISPTSSSSIHETYSAPAVGASDSISTASPDQIKLSLTLGLNIITSSSKQPQNVIGIDSPSFFGTIDSSPSSSIPFSSDTGSGSSLSPRTSESNSVVTRLITDQISMGLTSDSINSGLLDVADSAITASSTRIFDSQFFDQVSRKAQLNPSDLSVPVIITHHLMIGMEHDSQKPTRPLSSTHLDSIETNLLPLKGLKVYGSTEEYSPITTGTSQIGIVSHGHANSQETGSTSRLIEILTASTKSHIIDMDPTSSFRTGDSTEPGLLPTMSLEEKEQLIRIDGSGSSMVLHGQTAGVLIGTVFAAIVFFGTIFLFHRRCYQFFFRPKNELVYIMHDQTGLSNYQSTYKEISRFSEES